MNKGKTLRAILAVALTMLLLLPASFGYAEAPAFAPAAPIAGQDEPSGEGEAPLDAEANPPGDTAEGTVEDAVEDATGGGAEDGVEDGAEGAVEDGAEGVIADSDETVPSLSETEEPPSDELASTELSPQESTAKDTPLPAGRYRIRPASSDIRVLDVRGASKALGADVLVYRSNNGLNQLFDVSYDEDGYYTIKSVNSGQVLDVYGAQAKSGTRVIQYKANGHANQKWVLSQSLDTRGDAVYTVGSALPGNFMLDVYGGKDANDTKVQIWAKNTTKAQKFYFVPVNPKVESEQTVASGVYALSSSLSTPLSVEVAGAGDANGLQLQLASPKNTATQLFDVRWQAGGFYFIRPLSSGKLMDITGNQVVATTPIIQWQNNGGANQRWAITDNGDGTYSFIAMSCGLALDAASSRASAGTKLRLYYPSTSKTQRFKLTAPAANPLSEGIFTMSSYAATSKLVDIQGSSYKEGAPAIVYKANGGLNQKFQIKRTATSTYTFSSLQSGLYLTAGKDGVYQAAGSDGKPTAAQQWVASWTFGGVRLVNLSTNEAMTLNAGKTLIGLAAQNNTASQSFRFQSTPPVSPGYYVIKSASGFALDLNGGNVERGTNVQMYKPNSSAAQIWKLERGSGGYYTIANARSQKVLDISGGGTKDGTNVLAWDKTGVNWQKWQMVPSGDGWFYLRSATGMYLSVSGEGNYNKANVFAVTAITKTAQKFRFTPTTYTGYAGTYADVNLTTQKMIYVKNGELILETDIVTGAPSMKTPTGTFRIIGKQSPAVLRGPGYASPVTYWMPFTSSGVGFHDATWQSRFGGDWYTSHGSHGCVNMPLAAARTLYGKISTGDTVKVHY